MVVSAVHSACAAASTGSSDTAAAGAPPPAPDLCPWPHMVHTESDARLAKVHTGQDHCEDRGPRPEARELGGEENATREQRRRPVQHVWVGRRGGGAARAGADEDPSLPRKSRIPNSAESAPAPPFSPQDATLARLAGSKLGMRRSLIWACGANRQGFGLAGALARARPRHGACWWWGSECWSRARSRSWFLPRPRLLVPGSSKDSVATVCEGGRTRPQCRGRRSRLPPTLRKGLCLAPEIWIPPNIASRPARFRRVHRQSDGCGNRLSMHALAN